MIGLAGVAAALRTRRRRASYANTYGASGGIAFTIVQVGCSGVLLLGGIGLMALAVILPREVFSARYLMDLPILLGASSRIALAIRRWRASLPPSAELT